VLATVRKALAAADRGEVVQPELDALDAIEDRKPVIGGLVVGDAN
jgi:ACDE family multidrug resistance protein